MIISEFYANKSKTERKLEALQQLVRAEKALKATSFHITGGECISAVKLGSALSNITIAPVLSDRFFKVIIKAVEEHVEELKQLNKQIDQEEE